MTRLRENPIISTKQVLKSKKAYSHKIYVMARIFGLLHRSFLNVQAPEEQLGLYTQAFLIKLNVYLYIQTD